MSGELASYPGGDLVAAGLRDLAREALSEEALLVLVAGPRLRGLGFEIPELADITRPYEHALYSLIEERRPKGAHAAYNALIQRIVSFASVYGNENPARREAAEPD